MGLVTGQMWRVKEQMPRRNLGFWLCSHGWSMAHGESVTSMASAQESLSWEKSRGSGHVGLQRTGKVQAGEANM